MSKFYVAFRKALLNKTVQKPFNYHAVYIECALTWGLGAVWTETRAPFLVLRPCVLARGHLPLEKFGDC